MAKNNNTLIIGGVAGFTLLAAFMSLRKKSREQDLANKIVLITGGSRGLGLVLAREFADEGAKIAICARNAEELDRAKIELESRGAEVFASVCDVRQKDEVNKLIENVTAHFGQIDILINSKNIDFLRNVTQKNEEPVFYNMGLMGQRVLAGHTTCPTVVDWNRDGKPDLLAGAEDGRFYYMENPY